MDFNDTPEEAKFRKEASEWLKANFEKFENEKSSNDKSAKSSAEPSKNSQDENKALELAKKWQTIKYDAGWACLHWPKDYGGRDATPIERVIWAQEESKYAILEVFLKLVKEWLVQ